MSPVFDGLRCVSRSEYIAGFGASTCAAQIAACVGEEAPKEKR